MVVVVVVVVVGGSRPTGARPGAQGRTMDSRHDCARPPLAVGSRPPEAPRSFPRPRPSPPRPGDGELAGYIWDIPEAA
ncbi:hypothetical protein EYF80_037778 [Liparis tanakae]|uniref:Uncharacterized protein n=1 Tax=Liparis tanakae TaxID=230148 RepID=A0A4Z2GGZ7_9TELE|nr:hypothetical protein EYF80_037778 [Liparis tanakae]